MVVVMKERATEVQIDTVIARLIELGMDVHRSSGATRTVLGVVGSLWHAIVRDGIEPVPWRRRDGVHAGEGAEGRQHADVRSEPEAGQAQPVVRAAAQVHAGVQMPRQHIAVRHRGRVMAQRKRPHRARLIDALDGQRGRRVAGAVVVVASHQHELQAGMLLAPAVQCRERGGCMRTCRVQEVAEEDHPSGARHLDQAGQSVERRRGRPARHRNAPSPERHSLADMRVSDEQGAVIR